LTSLVLAELQFRRVWVSKRQALEVESYCLDVLRYCLGPFYIQDQMIEAPDCTQLICN
jgi:hypothetical protein